MMGQVMHVYGAAVCIYMNNKKTIKLNCFVRLSVPASLPIIMEMVKCVSIPEIRLVSSVKYRSH